MKSVAICIVLCSYVTWIFFLFHLLVIFLCSVHLEFWLLCDTMDFYFGPICFVFCKYFVHIWTSLLVRNYFLYGFVLEMVLGLLDENIFLLLFLTFLGFDFSYCNKFLGFFFHELFKLLDFLWLMYFLMSSAHEILCSFAYILMFMLMSVVSVLFPRFSISRIVSVVCVSYCFYIYFHILENFIYTLCLYFSEFLCIYFLPLLMLLYVWMHFPVLPFEVNI